MIDDLRAIRKIVRAGRPRIDYALAAIATLVVSAAVAALPPIFTGRIIDALQRGDTLATFRSLSAFIAVTIVAAILTFANTLATSAFREGVARELRVRLMRKLLTAKLSHLESFSFGEVANRTNDDLDVLSIRFEYVVYPMISSLSSLVATVALMVTLDIRFAALALAAVLLSFVPARLLSPHVTKVQKEDSRAQDLRATTISEYAGLAGLALLRHPRAMVAESRRYAAMADLTRSIRMRSAWLSGISSLSATITNLIGPAIILALGSYLLLHHGTTVGIIVTFLMYQGRLATPFTFLSNMPLQIANTAVFARRILQIDEIEDEHHGDAPFVPGDLVLDKATVIKGEREILRDASFTIPQGSHIAIVGPSGAGKSTTGSLLLRLYDPQHGTIRIGNTDLRELDVKALRESVVVVAQEPLLFDASLIDNLKFLNADATPGEIARAIRTCQLHDVIARLPEGYESQLGQRGFRLSGGERQRVCVARALLAKPQFLVLDEALTGVDFETEATIMRNLRETFTGKTMIVITHRLRSVMDFDRIVVIEDGAVTSIGAHDDALRSSPWYAEVIASQPAESIRS